MLPVLANGSDARHHATPSHLAEGARLLGAGQLLLAYGRQDRLGQWMRRSDLRQRRPAEYALARREVDAVAERHHLSQRGFASREGAGLVERHRVDASDALERGATAKQHAAARSAPQPRGDGYRGRDHERTRAGDHQQREGEMHVARDDERRHATQRHRRGVDAREALDHALCRSALGL